MKIAVDAMGGDFAPREIVQGAVQAVQEYGFQIILVGDTEKITAELGSFPRDKIELVHTKEVIAMDEHPASSVRKKKGSSIVQANLLVKEGSAQAVVSAGSTGAAMAASLLYLGRIKGIDRPAIASVLPTMKGGTVLLDVGANVDCKPQYLLQFAIMGNLYASKILGIIKPRVGLLNIGEEETKGNELTLAAFPLLRQSGIDFIGNVEGREVFSGDIDVIVCDGFVGNIVLKTSEGLAMALKSMIKQEISCSITAKLGILLTLPSLKRFRQRIDYTEYGGAPLLGINGISVISHGSSTAKAIKNAIRVAADAVENGLVSSIRADIEKGQDTKGVEYSEEV
ncbi:fatty acid/phospholipid synthesis protein PlsX [Desulfofarcimen acetoxidans DSM 771]|jgi:glycerol-3-phosphate acyltransferase PlsX|uniref:Phosphate acyltransferase n=1 Tax=Desulfofarcimen acetoxidans (strain ATCC 49208 / DSM 771 / KCTC 5769 / VKM B-1644 / 5575) TaxID=485916 RepID=C8W579_DESAS|nr:phosphate acyltransferase PlsX [Desulfofarcimen acetoxidans]ACV62061.1 fatty acid/phospholipid synthesis protein PlsX [Desulfofarcimen acetoxidans DSM 771]